MIPPFLDYKYIEFFSNNARYYWSSSHVAMGLVHDPYGVPAPVVISTEYFGGDDGSANTGFIGSGYAQAGLAGTAIYAIGVGLILAIFQSYGRYLGVPFLAAFMIVELDTMITGTDFLALMLTHGMLLALLLLTMLHAPEAQRNPRIRRDSRPPQTVFQTG